MAEHEEIVQNGISRKGAVPDREHPSEFGRGGTVAHAAIEVVQTGTPRADPEVEQLAECLLGLEGSRVSMSKSLSMSRNLMITS